MMFACITPALIIGSSAERVRLLPTLVFVLIWTTVVYDPVAYWTWVSWFQFGSIEIHTANWPANIYAAGCKRLVKTMGRP